MKRFLQQWPIIVAGLLIISGAGAATVINSSGRVVQPNQIDGLQMWLKADAISASNGDPVSTWSDQSGSNNDMSTEGAAPTYSADVLNGKPVLTFTTSQSLANDTLDLPSTWTVLYVTRLTGGTNGRTLQAPGNNWLLGTWMGDVNSAFYGNDIHVSGDAADTQWRIYVGEGNGSEGYFYSNGVLVATSTSVFAPPAGGLDFNTGQFDAEVSDMQVAELIAYNSALSATDVRGVENYLSQKYKIPLPGNKVTIQTITTNGLIGYWQLGSASISGTTVTDASPTHSDGTLATTASFQSGQTHNALMFDGTQHVTVPNFSAQIAGKTAMTITGWVNPGAQTGHAAYFGIRGDDNGDFYVLQLNGTNNLECRFVNSDGSQYQPDVQPLITAGTWQFVSLVYDGSSLKCSVNGVTQTAPASGSISATNLSLMIGTDSNGNNFTGAIEDVRVYDRALTDGELAALGGAHTTVNASQNARITDGLVGHWSFDGADMTWSDATDGVARDTSGNGYDGTLNNFSQKYSVVPGKIGQALRFNGSSYITTGYTIPSQDSSTSFTWSTWVKLDAGNPANAVILGFRTGDTWIKLTPTKFEYADGADASVSIPSGEWLHVAIVKDHSNITYYSDGVEVGSVEDTRSVSSGPFYIGEDPTSPDDGAFKGLLDDVRVYDRALSPAEIHALYLVGQQ